MVYAAYERSPIFGARLKSAKLDAVLKQPGVKTAFIVKGGDAPDGLVDGVAIIAKQLVAGEQGPRSARDRVGQWGLGSHSSEGYVTQAAALLDKSAAEIKRNDGDAPAAIAAAAKQVTADYAYPFVAHAPMEPQNCTALYSADGKLTLWAPTQLPQPGIDLVSKTLAIPAENITLHLTRMGGGFGRRLVNDFMVQSAAVAKQMPGTPVQLLWSREDDIRTDFYRPAGFHRLRAGIDKDGKLTGLDNHIVTFGRNGRPGFGGGMNGGEFPAQLVPQFPCRPVDDRDCGADGGVARAFVQRARLCQPKLPRRGGGGGRHRPRRPDVRYARRAARLPLAAWAWVVRLRASTPAAPAA